MIYAILLIAAGILVPDYYIWNTYVKPGPAVWSVIYWVPSMLFAVLTVCALVWKRFNSGVMNIFMSLLLGVALPKAIFALVSWIGNAEPLGYYGGLCIALLVMAFSFFGLIYGWRIVIVRNIELSFPSLPAEFDGYKIVQLTDFHIGTYHRSPDTVRKIVWTTNRQRPDAIVFTGDMVNLRPSEIEEFMPTLRRLHAPDGIYSILGNHDYCAYLKYRSQRGATDACCQLCRHERELGWHLLLNESIVLKRGDAEIAIVGVENEGKPPFPARADLDRAMKGLPEGIFKILLSHDPSHWRRGVLGKTDVQLTLSGHTHGMQFRIGRFSPSRFVTKEWGGVYRKDGRVLFVSTGVGSNLPFRFGAWPEVVAITLRHRHPSLV
ncbi:MAG: metallophosphoesterase [Muribaculaceae bacterium]|nr:metallophosphoesterase [Muribaculaceae bacterium]